LTAEARTITGSYPGSAVPARDIPKYAQLWREGRLPVETLIPSQIRLNDITKAKDELADGRSLRQVIPFEPPKGSPAWRLRGPAGPLAAGMRAGFHSVPTRCHRAPPTGSRSAAIDEEQIAVAVRARLEPTRCRLSEAGPRHGRTCCESFRRIRFEPPVDTCWRRLRREGDIGQQLGQALGHPFGPPDDVLKDIPHEPQMLQLGIGAGAAEPYRKFSGCSRMELLRDPAADGGGTVQQGQKKVFVRDRAL
jgi:hypothetical protein